MVASPEADRVGIDLQAVAAIRDSLREHDARYLERIYTEREVEDSRRNGAVDPERLAARFAAKEAALKVLRPTETDPVPWRSIEVRRRPEGWVELALSGPAADLAARAGLRDLSVSITHDEGYAAAVVIGRCS